MTYATLPDMEVLVVFKLNVIDWLDHSSFNRAKWRTFDEASDLGPIGVHTVGWVIKETKEYLIVASTLTDDETLMNEFCILKSCIKKRKVIRGY